MNQVLTRRASVMTVLGLDGVTVPYGPSSQRFGMESFPLALDGPDHTVARARIGEALRASSSGHHAGVEAAGQAAGGPGGAPTDR